MRFAASALGVIVLLSGVARTARAEELVLAPPIDSTRRDVGTALVGGGALLGAVGAGMYVITRPDDDHPCACSASSWVFPTVLMGLGGAMVATGVPLWITGQMGMDKAKARAELRLGPFGGSVRVLF